MARTSAQTVAQLVAQAGGVRQYLALAGVPAAPRPPKGRPPSPEYRAYRAARRSVERAITTRGKERHQTIAPKYAAKAEKAERNLRHQREVQAAAPAPQPAPAAGGGRQPRRIPRAVRITARMRYNTSDPREGRERTVTLPINGEDDWEDWLSDQEEYVNGLMGGALEDYELTALEYLY